MDESKIINQRISSVFNFIKDNVDKVSLIILGLIIWFSAFIRTRNLPGLRDITTGGWTLGPDLDPFLFLRWAKQIVLTGSLYAVDMMRNVPIGFNTNEELLLLPYSIAWFHKIAVIFGSSSIEQSAALYPVFMFSLTIIAFFLFVRKLFISKLGKSNSTYIALIASFFLSVIPALLPRTIAGIPEKESAAFLFMFLAFFLTLSAFSSSKKLNIFLFAIGAGLATAGMALIWGGVIYILLTISIAFFVSFFLDKISNSNLLVFPTLLVSMLAVTVPISARYNIKDLFISEAIGIPIAICLLILVHYVIYNTKIKNHLTHNIFNKIPAHITSFIVTILIVIFGMVVVQGPGAIFSRILNLINSLINPFTQTRFNITVAENRMPFFSEWAGSFGPYISNIPVFFWLFFIGSIYLFWNLASVFEKKAQRYLTLSYSLFLFAIIFSRFKSTSILNGTNLFSNIVYFSGMILLGVTFLYWYINYFKRNKLEELKSMDFGLLILFALFFLSLVSARGGVRLIMMIVPPASIIVAYLIVNLGISMKNRVDSGKVFTAILFGIVLACAMFSGVQFSKQSIATAYSYVPSSYTQQWQQSMSWVRDNVPEDAVFAHWWDYGYWVQSIGERATILDGGNRIVYWNHLMGRYVLTGPDEAESLAFLYSHNATHLLIDSTDIGKYPAFSSIGSDESYDRYSWINSFVKDKSRTVELKNSTVYQYSGGFVMDDDFVFQQNGTTILLPGLRSGVGAVLVEQSKTGEIKQPKAIAVYQGKQYTLPVRYVFDGTQLWDFGSGMDIGIVFIPSVEQTAQQTSVDPFGSLIYLSNKTVHSGLARYYLYGQETSAIKLVHSQDDPIVAQIKQLGLSDSDFVYYGGVRGPIKIWEINYPSNVSFNSEYLNRDFPSSELEKVSR